MRVRAQKKKSILILFISILLTDIAPNSKCYGEKTKVGKQWSRRERKKNKGSKEEKEESYFLLFLPFIIP